MVDVAGRILFSSPKHIVRTAFALSSSLVPMCCEGTLFTYTLYPLLLFLYANINYSSIYLLYRTLLWRLQKFKILLFVMPGVDCAFHAFHVDTTIYWNSFLRFWHRKALPPRYYSLLVILIPSSTYILIWCRLCWFSLLPIPAGWPLSGPRSSPVLNQGLAIPCQVAMWVMSYKEKKKIWYTIRNANQLLCCRKLAPLDSWKNNKLNQQS